MRDEIKLRWEFRRRKRRLNAAPAYRLAHRFQVELARMDPTPQVIEARRSANELLTKVLERDNTRVEEIAGTIKMIREEVEDDTTARQQALAELAAND